MQSLTIQGAVVSILGTILVTVGFTDSCANEIVVMAPALIGGIMSWAGRMRAGGVDIFGRRT